MIQTCVVKTNNLVRVMPEESVEKTVTEEKDTEKATEGVHIVNGLFKGGSLFNLIVWIVTCAEEKLKVSPRSMDMFKFSPVKNIQW